MKVDLGRDPDIYLARVDWAPDGRRCYVQRQSRDQKRLDMLSVDPATGKAARAVHREGGRGQLDQPVRRTIAFLNDGSLIWWSERDGFGHLYRFAARRAGRS